MKHLSMLLKRILILRRLFNRQDVESTILDANIMFAQECTLQDDNSKFIDDSSDEG